MARKWLDIGVIGHKWTQQEYKKGRFSNWLKSLKTLIIYLALESDAINANFDLVYSDEEIETHVRAIAENGRLFEGIPQDGVYVKTVIWII